MSGNQPNNEPRSQGGPKPREPLSRERIELSALELIEAEGMEGFSIRKLASALGCEAMSIYYYFPSKGHLMDGLIDHVIDEMPPLPDKSLPWIERLRIAGYGIRKTLTRRPNLFVFVATHRMNTPKALAWLDRFIGFFGESGLPHADSIRLFRSVSYFILSTGLDETAGYSRGPSIIAPVPEDIMARDYPEVAGAAPFFRPAQFDATFELGWETLLAGIEVRRAARGR
ncbi:MAG: TetR/AcrR family transcriptional regulator [Devosia sp.]